MQLSINLSLPPDVEDALRAETPNLDADAKEAYAVELFRRKKLTHYQLSKVLGIDRFETDGILKKHDVLIDMTLAEFNAELADLRGLVRE